MTTPCIVFYPLVAFEFTPPTYEVPHRRERPGRYSLMRFFSGIPTGRTVLIVGGTASTHPGLVTPDIETILAADSGSGYGGRAAFLGGRTWEVTSGEKTILENAGYTVETV